jgi:hypothetical protein
LAARHTGRLRQPAWRHWARVSLALSGRWHGWRVGVGGRLEEEPAQQAAIQRILALRDAGLSLRKIAAAMSATGIRLSHHGVKNVLDRALSGAERSRLTAPSPCTTPHPHPRRHRKPISMRHIAGRGMPV